MNCSKCKESTEAVYLKTAYNGNKDTDEYCYKCYFIMHGEYFNDTEFEITEGKNVATRVKGTEQ